MKLFVKLSKNIAGFCKQKVIFVVMQEFSLKSSVDALELAVAVMEPEGPAKGIFQISHGMCEHKERYYPFMAWMASHGYVCVINDHRGHGASVKSEADLGFMYEGGWRALVEDLKTVGDWARSQYPGLPFTLFGHSMGSLAVRSYTKRYDATIDRLIVCGSPSDNPAKGIGRMLAAGIGLVRGSHHRPMIMQKMSFGTFNKPFEGETSATGRHYHSAWVCSNKEILDAYHKDPLCQFIFTSNGFKNLMGMMQDCYSSKGWSLRNTGIPVHFISGAEDPCRTSDKAFRNAVQAMKKLGYSCTDGRLYPGMRHEILNETGQMIVWNDILSMMD